MIEEGFRLMLVGMSGVFGFLLLLVGLMQASGRVWRVLAVWFPEPVSVKSSSTPGAAFRRAEGAEEERIAAVLAIAGAARRSGGN